VKASTLKMRRWRKKNPERQREINNRWRRNNLKKARAKNRDWYKRNRSYKLKQNSEYFRNNKKKIAKRIRLRNHKLSQQRHDQMLKKQHNRCAICRKKFEKTPHIDHNHKCCRPMRSCDKCRRGLLCEDCNLGLGRFKDSVVALTNAIEYLKGYQK
jgi:hypothetical protein